MIFDPLTHGIPLIITLVCIYIFFKVAGFFIKIILAVVCLLMLVYLGMSIMGVHPDVMIFRGQ